LTSLQALLRDNECLLSQLREQLADKDDEIAELRATKSQLKIDIEGLKGREGQELEIKRLIQEVDRLHQENQMHKRQMDKQTLQYDEKLT
jgi:peptidoglycan hydrolase CwlO-like protein